MLSSSLETLLKVSKTTCPYKLFAYDCVTLYIRVGKKKCNFCCGQAYFKIYTKGVKK